MYLKLLSKAKGPATSPKFKSAPCRTVVTADMADGNAVAGGGKTMALSQISRDSAATQLWPLHPCGIGHLNFYLNKLREQSSELAVTDGIHMYSGFFKV